MSRAGIYQTKLSKYLFLDMLSTSSLTWYATQASWNVGDLRRQLDHMGAVLGQHLKNARAIEMARLAHPPERLAPVPLFETANRFAAAAPVIAK